MKSCLKDSIINLREQGYSYRKIAKELKCSLSTVFRNMQPVREKKERKVLKLNEFKADKIKELAMQGVRPYDIMNQLGVSYTAYARYGKPYYVSKFDYIKEESVKLKKEGLTIKQIAEKLGVNHKTVANYVKGIKSEVIKVNPVQMKKPLKKIKKEIVPQEIARDYLNKGFEKGEMPVCVLLRDNRDSGELVKIVYDAFGVKKVVEARNKKGINNKVFAYLWCKKMNKKFVSLG